IEGRVVDVDEKRLRTVRRQAIEPGPFPLRIEVIEPGLDRNDGIGDPGQHRGGERCAKQHLMPALASAAPEQGNAEATADPEDGPDLVVDLEERVEPAVKDILDVEELRQ